MPIKIDFLYLIKAIEENENITVHFEVEDNKTLVYRSRFFEVSEEDKYIIIDFPSGESESAKPLVPNDPVFVHFKFAGFRFLFYSKIIEKINYQLNPEKSTRAFKIRLPSKLLDGNRRKYFRVTVPMDQPISLFYRKLSSRDKESPETKQTAVKSKSFEALMIDISEGGIAIKSEGRPAISKGDKLSMWFKLAGETNEIKMEAVVRSTRQYGEKEVHLWGVEFVPKKDINYKRALRRINKYVMSTQRRLLANLR
jgi:c-di-GMP-binding flagellar brake protein YcgR